MKWIVFVIISGILYWFWYNIKDTPRYEQRFPELPNLSAQEREELADLLVRSGTVSTRYRRRAKLHELLIKCGLSEDEVYRLLFVNKA